MNAFLDRIINALGSFFVAKKGIETCRKGNVVKTLFSLILLLFAAVTLIGGIITFFRALFDGNTSFISMLKIDFGYALMQLCITCILLAAAVLMTQIFIYHARNVTGISDTEYTASFIFSDLMRMLGELGLVLFVAAGTVFFIASLGSGGSFLMRAAMGIRGADGIGAGIAALLVAPLFGGLILLTFYFLAERIIILTDISKNTKK